jgi:hypothetical protein
VNRTGSERCPVVDFRTSSVGHMALLPVCLLYRCFPTVSSLQHSCSPIPDGISTKVVCVLVAGTGRGMK